MSSSFRDQSPTVKFLLVANCIALVLLGALHLIR